MSADVTVQLGDSRQFLLLHAERPTVNTDAVFVYLDAHWQEDLPLAEELRIVASVWTRCVVMVDDFQVPGDSGYAYDDYGPGLALTEDYLPTSMLRGLVTVVPICDVGDGDGGQTGMLRSCVAAPSKARAGTQPSAEPDPLESCWRGRPATQSHTRNY